MRREPRLQFTKEERESPALEKTIRKADRAAARADKAQAKVPKRKVKQRTVDPETGTVTVRLQFEAKKPPSKLQHTLRDAPADTVLGAVHRELRQSEADNVGLESAHKTEKAAESAGRLVRAGYRSHKLHPYRKAAAAERKLERPTSMPYIKRAWKRTPAFLVIRCLVGSRSRPSSGSMPPPAAPDRPPPPWGRLPRTRPSLQRRRRKRAVRRRILPGGTKRAS